MSCCGIKETVARIKADMDGNPDFKNADIDEADFVMVEYIGGKMQKTQVPSPSHVLQREYGFRPNHYGQHRHGDVFAVHKADLKKAPRLFRKVKETEATSAEPMPDSEALAVGMKPNTTVKEPTEGEATGVTVLNSQGNETSAQATDVTEDVSSQGEATTETLADSPSPEAFTIPKTGKTKK